MSLTHTLPCVFLEEYSGGMKRLLSILLLVFSVGVGAYDEDDLKKLKANKDCMKCDLSGAYLTGANLSYANLRFADLTDANLDSADLSGADLTRANLERANLEWANLIEADLTEANLTGAIFCKTKMPDGTQNNSGC